MFRAGGIAAVALLALAACERPGPPSDITGLLRAQGFDFLDEPTVTISPLCSMRVGQTRYDFFWYVWRQQPDRAPGVPHAAHRLIQIRDGQIYDGHYGSMQPEDRPTCRPDSRELVFKADALLAQEFGAPPEAVLHVAESGLPQHILVNGEAYTRAR